MVPIIATAVAALAALLHVYIFVMESIQWTQPRVWRRFGVADQAAADVTKPMAYNQGFYNLFLAIGVVIGLALFWAGDAGTTAEVAGRALVLFSLGSMLAAALVLAMTLIYSGGRGAADILSAAMTFSCRTPMALISSSVAMPAAPGPFSTTFMSSRRRPVISQAFISPAAVMMASSAAISSSTDAANSGWIGVRDSRAGVV